MTTTILDNFRYVRQGSSVTTCYCYILAKKYLFHDMQLFCWVLHIWWSDFGSSRLLLLENILKYCEEKIVFLRLGLHTTIMQSHQSCQNRRNAVQVHYMTSSNGNIIRCAVKLPPPSGEWRVGLESQASRNGT